MADVTLDTPVGVYGLPAALLPGRDVLTGYARLSPSSRWPTARLASWWSPIPVVPLQLPHPVAAARADDGSWLVPDGLLHVTGPAAGTGTVLCSAQVAVNAAHVADLAAALRRGDGPGPPVHTLRLGEVAWVVDGVHRVCAALAVGCTTLDTRQADAATVTSCPCGWAGHPGGLLRHPCLT